MAIWYNTLLMSPLPVTDELVQVQVLGSSKAFEPDVKLLSELVLNWSTINWVILELGVPELSKTNPPEPAAPATQSPTPLVGVLASRSPSISNPPEGF